MIRIKLIVENEEDFLAFLEANVAHLGPSDLIALETKGEVSAVSKDHPDAVDHAERTLGLFLELLLLQLQGKELHLGVDVSLNVFVQNHQLFFLAEQIQKVLLFLHTPNHQFLFLGLQLIQLRLDSDYFLVELL